MCVCNDLPYGRYAIDHDSLERILKDGTETAITRHLSGSRNEPPNGKREDVIDFSFPATLQILIKFFIPLPPRRRSLDVHSLLVHLRWTTMTNSSPAFSSLLGALNASVQAMVSSGQGLRVLESSSWEESSVSRVPGRGSSVSRVQGKGSSSLGTLVREWVVSRSGRAVVVRVGYRGGGRSCP